MKHCDLLFVTDADPTTGMGHLARCLQVARLLSKRRSLSMALLGDISAPARQFMALVGPDIPILAHGSLPATRLAFVDRMADPLNAEAWDRQLISQLRPYATTIIQLFSGTTMPVLPDGVMGVGYQPGGPPDDPPWRRWGLGFAPVHRPAQHGIPDVQPGNCLLAIGGAIDVDGPRRALLALVKQPWVTSIDVLVSPAWKFPLSALVRETATEVPVKPIEGVRDICPVLARAEVVLATQGNLAYEAIGLPRPTVLVGLKAFQHRIADALAEQGVCLSAGDLATTDATAIAAVVDRARTKARSLMQNGKALLDGGGYDRLTDLIITTLDRRPA